MTSSSSVSHIMLTGSPGIGKTTLIQKVCEILKTRNVPMKGFYTTELKEDGRRIGFDVVTLDGVVKPLARIGNDVGPRVGQYVVQVQSFESVALPILQTTTDKSIIIIDEIGKMELFSRSFESAVKRMFSENVTILGTVPELRRKPMPFVDFIRSHTSVQLFKVDLSNRDTLAADIVDLLISILKGKGSQ